MTLILIVSNTILKIEQKLNAHETSLFLKECWTVLFNKPIFSSIWNIFYFRFCNFPSWSSFICKVYDLTIKNFSLYFCCNNFCNPNFFCYPHERVYPLLRLLIQIINNQMNSLIKLLLNFGHAIEVGLYPGAFDGSVLYLVLIRKIIQWLYGRVQARHCEKRSKIGSVRGYDDESEQPPGCGHQPPRHILGCFTSSLESKIS